MISSGVQGVGLNEGGGAVVGVVVAARTARRLLGLAGATVVGVTGGGGSASPLASGGGLVGVVRLGPEDVDQHLLGLGLLHGQHVTEVPEVVGRPVGSVWACRLAGSKEW